MSPLDATSDAASPSTRGSDRPRSSAGGAFLTTRWSVVRRASAADEPHARLALAELCTAYWRPLYVYARRSGRAREDAADLTQGFFARLLEKRDVGGADPQRGRFRAYLLGAFKHFLANEWDRERSLRRGGGQVLLSLDFDAAEAGFVAEPSDPATPEHAFERSWALAVLERAYARVESDYRGRGRGALFEALRAGLVPTETLDSHRAIGLRLGQSEGAIKVAAHRLRRAFRTSLRAEIAETLESEAEIEAELAHLIAALAPPGA